MPIIKTTKSFSTNPEDLGTAVRSQLHALLGEELMQDYEATGFSSAKGDKFIRMYFKGLGQGAGSAKETPQAFDTAKKSLLKSLKLQLDRINLAITKLQ
jgi:hypothetical protein